MSAVLLAACNGGTSTASTPTDVASDAADTDAAPDAAVTSDSPADDEADAQSQSDAADTTDEVAADAPPADDDGSADASSDHDSNADAEPLPWRSALYPTDWTPAFTDDQGRFLHDFSYAGYHGGTEEPPDDPPGPVVDVVADEGADPTGATDATAAIQAAIDAVQAEGGGVVHFPAGLFRVDDRLRVSHSGVVLRGEGADSSRIYFTRTDGMSFASHLTIAGTVTSDLEVPLAADAAARDTAVLVDDAGDLAVGDDVDLGWVVTPEFIAEHGMTGTWTAFNDTWQPFFHRQVVAIDRDAVPNRITLDVPLRYPAKLRDSASLRRQLGLLRECGVEDLGFSNAVAWADAWAVDQVHALELTGVADCWVRRIASFASPLSPTEGKGAGTHLQSGGLMVLLSKRVTVGDSTLGFAENRGGGGNGYLFEVRQSSEVLFRDLVGQAGRHNFIENWGFGTTGCVWLRVQSRDGRAEVALDSPIFGTGYSEFHHSLATANLIDSSTLDDGWLALNRRTESTGAGQSATQDVFWNDVGRGEIRTAQFGWGYVIGTGPDLDVNATLVGLAAEGTEPEDWVEGSGQAAGLEPPSLYLDQLARRLGR